MLATLQPMQNDIKPPHEFSFKYSHSRYSPPESPRQLPSFLNGGESAMNNSHRGLPAPHGLSLPPPDRGQSNVPSLGHLPPPPPQWTGQDDSMKNWLHAKAEEDRRKQEEERTKQETLRLDQRRIEQNMLRESLQGGVPPPMVPLIFAGMGGGNLPGHTLEWAQQYLAQLSIQTQQQQQQQQIQVQQQQIQQQQQPQPLPSAPIRHPSPPSPDIRRDTRMIPPNPYGAQQHSQPSVPQSHSQMSSASRGLLQGPPSNSTLSRLNTAELQPQPVPSSTPSSRHSGHPLQQSQTAQSDQSAGPSLFFHHWTPPSNSSGVPPPTPSGKSQHVSPFAQQPPSHLRSEYQNSPKKRRIGATNSSGPTSQPQDPSPPGSSHRDYSPRARSRERRHSRQHSDASSRDTDPRPVVRPSSRQQRQDELSGVQPYQT